MHHYASSYCFLSSSTYIHTSPSSNNHRKTQIKPQRKKEPTSDLPSLRNRQQRTPIIITPRIRDLIPPPIQIDLLILDSKEDNNGRDSHSTRHSSREHIRVLLPPRLPPSLDPIVKDEAHHHRTPRVRDIVRRDIADPVEHQRDINISEKGARAPFGDKVEGDGKEGANEEAV